MLGPDGAYVATLESSPHYADGTVTVWSTVTGRDLFTIEANYARFGIEPASHAMLVVVWGDIHGSTKLRAFDAATGAPRWAVESPHRVYDVAIDRHGTLTALADFRGSLVQYDLATGALRREIPTDANAARLQVSDDSTTAIAAETVMELPASGTQGVKLVEAPRYPTLSPDGRTLAIGRANGEVAFTERDGTSRTTVAHAGDDLQFLDDGSLLALDKTPRQALRPVRQAPRRARAAGRPRPRSAIAASSPARAATSSRGAAASSSVHRARERPPGGHLDLRWRDARDRARVVRRRREARARGDRSESRPCGRPPARPSSS